MYFVFAAREIGYWAKIVTTSYLKYFLKINKLIRHIDHSKLETNNSY